MNERPENMDEYNAYDLAMLAAQIRPGLLRQDTREAIEIASELLEKAKSKLSQIDNKKGLEAALPQLEAEALEQEEKRLAALKLKYEKGVEIITVHEGKGHWERALEWFKKFLKAKAKKEGKTDTWVGAKLLTHRGQGFTGTEAKKLREEFVSWRGYRGQGRVKRKTDLRLKKNKHLKGAAPAKQPRGRQRENIELVPENLDAVEAKQAKAGITPRRPDWSWRPPKTRGRSGGRR